MNSCGLAAETEKAFWLRWSSSAGSRTAAKTAVLAVDGGLWDSPYPSDKYTFHDSPTPKSFVYSNLSESSAYIPTKPHKSPFHNHSSFSTHPSAACFYCSPCSSTVIFQCFYSHNPCPPARRDGQGLREANARLCIRRMHQRTSPLPNQHTKTRPLLIPIPSLFRPLDVPCRRPRNTTIHHTPLTTLPIHG